MNKKRNRSKRIPRLYVDSAMGGGVTIDGPEFHHLIHVLRCPVGTRIQLFDGTGREFIGELVEVHKAFAEVKLISETTQESPNGIVMALAWALSKSKATEFILQKSTELGVAYLNPFVSQHSVTNLKSQTSQKLEKWRRITIEAAKQCGRSQLPIIDSPVMLTDLIQKSQRFDLRILPHPGSSIPLRQILRDSQPKSILMTIGPEGGFESEELEEMKSEGFKEVSLGQETLRTETACIAALAAIKYEFL